MECFNVHVVAISMIGNSSYENILFRANRDIRPCGHVRSRRIGGRRVRQNFPGRAAINGILAVDNRARWTVVASNLDVRSDLQRIRQVRLHSDDLSEKLANISRHSPGLGTGQSESRVRHQGVVNWSSDDSGRSLGAGSSRRASGPLGPHCACKSYRSLGPGRASGSRCALRASSPCRAGRPLRSRGTLWSHRARLSGLQRKCRSTVDRHCYRVVVSADGRSAGGACRAAIAGSGNIEVHAELSGGSIHSDRRNECALRMRRVKRHCYGE